MNRKGIYFILSLLLISSLEIIISSCSKKESVLVASSIELLSERNQTALIETELAKPVEVLIKDLSGNVYAGLDVYFTVSEGSVSSNKVTTNKDGKASTIWTLGNTEGTQTLVIKAYGADGTTFLSGAPMTISANAKLEANVVIDIEGNIYDIVSIGNQVWMAENLKTTKYPNGIAIPHIKDDLTWGNLSDNGNDDSYCYYRSITHIHNDVLYTWAAAMGDNVESSTTNITTIQGVCPDNWHLPSETEWQELVDFLNGPEVAGGKMKKTGTDYWTSPNTGATNESGFSALPLGCRTSLGSFIAEGFDGFWWSSSKVSETNAWNIVLSYHHVDVLYDNSLMSYGFSVRCVKD
jgi:uncharacterized protein (TIGR02145 family)